MKLYDRSYPYYIAVRIVMHSFNCLPHLITSLTCNNSALYKGQFMQIRLSDKTKPSSSALTVLLVITILTDEIYFSF